MSLLSRLSLLFKGGGKVAVNLSDDIVKVGPTVVNGTATLGTKVAGFIKQLPLIRLTAASSLAYVVYDFYNTTMGTFEKVTEYIAKLLNVPPEAIQLMVVTVFVLVVISLITAILNRNKNKQEEF